MEQPSRLCQALGGGDVTLTSDWYKDKTDDDDDDDDRHGTW